MQYGISSKTVQVIRELLNNTMLDIDTTTGSITVIKADTSSIKILPNKYGYNRQDIYGYYYLHVKFDSKYYNIKEHMIIAYLVYGSSIIGNQIDHINNYHNYQYDNRASNLQVLSISKHNEKSRKQGIKNLNRTITYYPKHIKDLYKYTIKISGVIYQGNTYQDIADTTGTPISVIKDIFNTKNKGHYPDIEII